MPKILTQHKNGCEGGRGGDICVMVSVPRVGFLIP